MHISVHYLTNKSFKFYTQQELAIRLPKRWMVSIDIAPKYGEEVYSYTARFATKPTRKQIARCKKEAIGEFNWMFNEGK